MDNIIPCLGIVTMLVVFLAFILGMRYLNYRETMQLAEKGLVRPARANGNGKSSLIWGLIITATGLALIIGLWPVGAMLRTDIPFGFGPWMLVGLIPTFFGLALILIHVLTREDKNDKKDLSLPDGEEKEK
jgi:hypothetical protein